MVLFIAINLLFWQLTAVQAVDLYRAPNKQNPFERIDTHSHFVPPFWREESIKYGYGKPDGMPGIPVSLARHILVPSATNRSKGMDGGSTLGDDA